MPFVRRSAMSRKFNRQMLDLPNVIARAGATRKRNERNACEPRALGRFGFESACQQFFSSVRTRVEGCDGAFSRICAPTRARVGDALNHIGEGRYRGLPVVGDNDECVGLDLQFQNQQLPVSASAASRGHARNIVASVEGIARNDRMRVWSMGRPTRESVEMTLCGRRHADGFLSARRLDQLEPERTVLVVGDRPEHPEDRGRGRGPGSHRHGRHGGLPGNQQARGGERHDRARLTSRHSNDRVAGSRSRAKPGR